MPYTDVMMQTKPLGHTFELWDLVSRNIVGEFDAELEALALVRSLTSERGQGTLESFALVREDEQGNSVTIATGEGLIALALRSGHPAGARTS